MRLWWVSALLLFLAAAPVVDATWNQMAGDAQHSGRLDAPTGPWDIVNTYTVLEEGEFFNRHYGPAMVETPHGAMGVARRVSDDSCIGVRISDPLEGIVERAELPDCSGGHVQAYVPSIDAVIVCHSDEIHDASMRALDAQSWDEIWRVTPTDLGMTAAALPGEPPVFADCRGVAFDEAADELVAAWPVDLGMYDMSMHRVSSIRASTGEVNWARSFTPAALGRQPLPDPGASADTYPEWAPQAATLTTNGILVMGFGLCPDAAVCEDMTGPNPYPARFIAAWMTREGEPKGMLWSGIDPVDGPTGAPEEARATFGTIYGSAQGGIATTLVGRELVRIDPLEAHPLERIPIDHTQALPQDFASFPQPLPDGDKHILTIRGVITSLDEDGDVAWQFMGLGPGWFPAFATPATTSGETFRIFAKLEQPGGIEPFERIPARTKFVVLDTETGAVKQIADTHLDAVVTTEPHRSALGDTTVRRHWASDWFAPIEDGFVWGDANGIASVFQHHTATPPPPMDINLLYPDAGERVDLTLHRDDHPDAYEVTVDWGNGAQAIAWSSDADFKANHTYHEAGPQSLSLGIQANITYQNRVFTLDVGGSPPAGRSAPLQDMTVHDLSPNPGDPVTVELPTLDDAVELWVRWNDGDQERYSMPAEGPLHVAWTFHDAGAVESVFTVVFLDGSTATRRVQFDVGGTATAADASLFGLSPALAQWAIAGPLLSVPVTSWAALAARRHASTLPAAGFGLIGVAIGAAGSFAGPLLAWSLPVGGAAGTGLGLLFHEWLQLRRDSRAQVVRPGVVLAGRYRVGRAVGQGAEGTVYVARDRKAGHKVALKTVQVRSEDRAALESSQTLCHPNLIATQEVIPVAAGHCIVMEYAAGGPIGLPVAREAFPRLVCATLEGLADVHAAGLVHRDIKPSNLLLCDDGEVKIADFGLARLVHLDETIVNGTAQGTIAYMSPEQALGRRCTSASDLYSLAAVLYEAWAGHPHARPRPDETVLEFQMRLTKGLPVALAGLGAPGLAAWFQRALDPDPACRFPSARAMADAFRALNLAGEA